MGNIAKKILLGLALLLVVTTAISVYWMARGGAFKTINPAFDGECTGFPLTGSAEDILIDHERGFAYLSVLDRMGVAQGRTPEPGTVARLDLNVSPPVLSNALTSTTDVMNPHGLSLHIDADGTRWLFMINHPADRANGTETVNRYKETGPGLFTYIETLSHPDITSPNDLVAVGANQVYVVNDKGATGTLGKMQEQLFGKGYSKLVYLDNGQGRSVLDDVASGGGINASPDGKLIYIAETGGQTLRVLERDPANGDLADIASIDLGTSPDNIDVAQDGSFTVAAHANLLALIQHFISGEPAPTQVLAIDRNTDGSFNVEEIYLNAGEQMSAGSVGATYGNTLLIGSITERKILICERNL